MNIKYILSLACTATFVNLHAQENPNISYSKEKETALKLHTSAFLGELDLPAVGNTELGYFYEGGDFRHPFTGKSKQGLNFSTEKFQRTGDWTLYGRFNFTTLKEKQLPYASLVNPIRDNPYQIVDSLKGDWNKQFYAMSLKVASPRFAGGRMRAGLDLSYQVATGARQMDPRSLDTENKIQLAPNISYRISKRHQLGLAGMYNYHKNDLRLTRANENQQYNIYKLLGIGEYMGAAPLLMTGDIYRNYITNAYGSEVSYRYEGDQLRWLLSGRYLHHNEKVTDGVTYPMKAGKHTSDHYTLLSALDLKRGTYNHHFDLNLSYTDISDTEYQQLQRADDRSYETIFEGTLHTAVRSQASLGYMLAKETSAYRSNWFAKASVSYSGWDNRYALPQSMEIIDRVDIGLRFNKALSRWIFDLASNYSFAVKNEWNYTDKDYSSNFVANNVALPIYQYLSQDRVINALSIQYRLASFGKNNNQLYVKGSGSLETALSGATGPFEKGQSRYMASLTVGLLTF
ncbi:MULTISPECIES: DUF6850 family outer membrane beta-barrel protein [Sphingobacterium]|uniref:DUF6850 family outer membrane beta-barrel protein n=1 Tax=Sphingobacterium TaxID=28453 RepID=UPI00257EBE11|nr:MULTISPECIES: DUF6850 family outer membrane beta-barrel protein [Sphingobacterium]